MKVPGERMGLVRAMKKKRERAREKERRGRLTRDKRTRSEEALKHVVRKETCDGRLVRTYRPERVPRS